MTTLSQVKELRERTGCGIVDCQEALRETDGDIEQAITLLRQKGKAQAAKKAQRATQEGAIAAYVHSNGKVAALVSLLCETDFVARNEKFQELARNLALHITAMDPVAVKPEEVSAEAVAAEEKVAQAQATESGKPAQIQEKMVAGKVEKFKTERALLTQPYVKDPNKTVTDVINEAVAELGENITVGTFQRIVIGE